MELLERFAQGDVEAFEALFCQLQGEVYGWIVRIVRDPGQAEDLTVETFWRMYRARARFDPGRPIGAWARRIATNAALDHLRARRPESELLKDPPRKGRPRTRPCNARCESRFNERFAACRQSCGWRRCWRWLRKGHTRKLQTRSEPRWVPSNSACFAPSADCENN